MNTAWIVLVLASAIINCNAEQMVGGITPMSPEELAEKKAVFIAALSRINGDFKLDSLENCSKQLVAGSLYRCDLKITSGDSNDIKTCHIKLWDRPWISEVPEISSETCSSTKSKRSVVGGFEPVDTNTEVVQDLAAQGAHRVSLMVNSPFVKRVSNILKAEQQVVSGVNYAITIEITDTDCLKSTVTPNSVCNFASEPVETLICSMNIYEQPWKKVRKFSNIQCHNVKLPSVNVVKRSLGGEEDLAVDSPIVVDLLDFVATEATARTNANRQLKVIRTVSAKQKIVSGREVILKVVIGTSEGQDEKLCDVTIWEQPWLKSRKVTKFSCENGYLKQVPLPRDEVVDELGEILGVDVGHHQLLQFASFKSVYDVNYTTNEETRERFRVFQANLLKIKYLQKTEQGTGVYGITQFSDLKRSEFKKRHLGLKDIPEDRPFPSPDLAPVPDVTLPKEFDWRDYGAVTPVKNQGSCGSCWAFSVTGNIEGLYAVANKKLVSLSEQELVDCDKLDNGCEGGLFWSAFESVKKLGGLETESEYPYEGRDDTCIANKSAPVIVNIQSYKNISNDEEAMAKHLVKYGPISVAVNANAMQFYMGGVSHPFRFLCNPQNLDHGVLIVGFGVHRTSILHKTLPYWAIKNSWGTNWGKEGYYWLYRGDGSCGINQMPTTAIL